jgi:hypothetical protein
LLWCSACGRADECAPADLLRYTREGWPRCCGQVMAYFAEAERPASDDTKTDRPPLPGGVV